LQEKSVLSKENAYLCKRINNEYNLNYKPIGTPLLKYKSF